MNLTGSFSRTLWAGILIALSLHSTSAFSEDATNRVSNTLKIGNWTIVEFSLPQQLVYRIAAESKLENEKSTIFFDLSPSESCKPRKAIMTQFIGRGSQELTDLPFMPMNYKINGSTIYGDIAKTEMDNRNGFFFTAFNSLTVDKLKKEKGKGNLSVWIQPDGDGKVKVYKMYFPLNGFNEAYNKASELCQANR
ncbi:TPA: hypothetical protein ACQ39K_001956 [Yersinia enterocolitica]